MKKNKIYIWASLGALAIFLVFTWISDLMEGEEARVRKFILRGARVIQAKNLIKCNDMVSGDYQDKYGNDRGSLLYITKQFFSYYKYIVVSIESVEVDLEESKDEATVVVTALVLGKSNNNTEVKILEGEKGKFKVRLVKKDKDWNLQEIEFYEPQPILWQNIS